MKRLLSNLQLYFYLVNSVLGTGVLVNHPFLGSLLGGLSFLVYPFGFFLICPVLYCVAKLAMIEDLDGAMFSVIKETLGEGFAVVSVWSYFLGRVAFLSVLINFLSLNVLVNFGFSESYLNVTILMVFCLILVLKFLGVSGEGWSRRIFVFLKIFPIFFLSFLALVLVGSKKCLPVNNFSLVYKNFFAMLPFAIYSFTGFTVVMHIRKQVAHPEQIMKILFLSMATISVIYAGFQWSIFNFFRDNCSSASVMFFYNVLGVKNIFLQCFFKSFLAMAVFANCFIILTGNPKNLYTLAKKEVFPGSNFLQYNYKKTHLGSVVATILISLLMLGISSNVQSLLAIAATSIFFWYLITSIAILRIFYNSRNWFAKICSVLSICVCIFVICVCSYNVVLGQVSWGFLAIFVFGVIGYLLKKRIGKFVGNF